MRRHFGAFVFRARHFAARHFRGLRRAGAFTATETGRPSYVARQGDGGASWSGAERGRPAR